MSTTAAGQPHRLTNLAAFVVVSFGLALGQVVVLPVVLAVFIVIVTTPLYQGLKRRGVRDWVARIIVMACVFVALGTLFLVGAMVLRGLVVRMPLYEVEYGKLMSRLSTWLQPDTVVGQQIIGLVPAPERVAAMLTGGMQTIVSHLWPAWLLVFLVQDALADADGWPRTVLRVLPEGDRLWRNWRVSAGLVRAFMRVKSAQGAFKAVIVFGLLTWLGVDFPLAWALVVFLATFLPQAIGQPLALVGPALMAMIGPGAWPAAVYVGAYSFLEWVSDELFESSLDGAMRLSNFQSGVAVFYWTLVLGPLGAFLAGPLTVMVRAVLASFEASWPIAMVMIQENPQPPVAGEGAPGP